jgi:formate hydrogenlyase subunit 6/NADH:ubiquinone oxidoreductase subunit I
MCPLPEKAIKLEAAQVQNAAGEAVTVKLPHVNRETCIGCGIRVYAPTMELMG